MIFERLTIQNFLSIKSITLDLKDRGLVLLKGKNLDNESLNNNGAGKSSIIEAMVYALYGRTLRGLKGDAVVHKIPGKNMKIFLDLTDDDGTQYRIARYRKHATNKNKSFLYRNSKDITPKSEADFNACVANLLQADYLTFTSSLLYSAESFKFTSATDAEMKSTFDTMLGLDVYQKCLEITKNRLKAVESELASTQWKIEDRKTKLAELDEQIQNAEQEKQEYSESLLEKKKLLESQVKDYEKQLGSLQDELGELQEQLEKVKSEKSKAEKALDTKRKKLKEVEELKSAVQDIKDEIQEHEREVRKQNRLITETQESQESCNDEVLRLKKKIQSLEQKLVDLDGTVGTPCPTCGQPLTEQSIEPAKQEVKEQIEHYQQNIEKQLAKVEKLNTSLLGYQSKIKELQDQIKELQDEETELSELIKKSKKLVDEKTAAEEVVQKVQEKYYEQESAVKLKSGEIKQVKTLLNKAQQDILSLSSDNPYDAIIDKYQREQEKAKSEIEEYTDSIKDKVDEKECLLFWQQAYSNQGIKSFVLDDITPFLNRRVNKYLAKLTSGHIEVKFNTQTTLKSGEIREKFSIDISNQDGGGEYSANSGGEKKRIDLAINLALQDLVASRSSKRINIAIWDEVFDALDETGIEKVIELLQELSQEKSTILVVSHNQHLQSYFTNTITVVKKNGFSTLLDEEEDEQVQESMRE